VVQAIAKAVALGKGAWPAI